MNINVVDFETRSEINLADVGAWNYSLDDTTEVLCLAYKINNAPTKIWTFKQGYEIPGDLANSIGEGSLFECFNFTFEFAIWNNIMHKRYGWPYVDLDNFRCTQARASQFALPRSLEKAAEGLDLQISKDKDGHKTMLKMCKPRKITKNNPNKWVDDEDNFNKLFSYCKDDVEVTSSLKNKLLQLTQEKKNFLDKFSTQKDKELQVFKLNNKINLKGVFLDKELAEKSLVLIDKHLKTLNNILKDITKGEIETAAQVVKIKEYLNAKGFMIPNLSSKTIDLWITKAEGDVKKILEIRRSLGRSSIKKIKAMLDRVSSDGRIKDIFAFHGAGRTGRFSSLGTQLHNVIRPIIDNDTIDLVIDLIKSDIDYYTFSAKFPDVLGTISSCLRGMITPEKGNKFLDSDFSAIEARVGFWLSQEKAGLDSYLENKDVYKEMASIIYDKPIHKVSSDERQLGKAAILGLSFGMSYKKFMLTCESNGIRITEELAKKSVDIYRRRYENLVGYWGKLEKAAIKAVLQSGKCFEEDKIKFVSSYQSLYMILPSGRALAYLNPIIKMNNWGKPFLTYLGYSSQIKKFERQETWGGKLFENACQAVARDFMIEAMLRLDKAKFNIALHVHDQIIVEVDENSNKLEEFNKIMEIVPSWGAGCPIKSESFECKRFKK